MRSIISAIKETDDSSRNMELNVGVPRGANDRDLYPQGKK